MNLVLVTADDSRPKRLRYFREQARQLAAIWGANTDLLEVRTGVDVLDRIDAAVEPIEHLGLVAHGGPDWWRGKRRGVRVGHEAPPALVSVDQLVEVLGHRAAVDIHVAIAACWTGANRYRLIAPMYGPGGERSFAAHLYRGLVAFSPRVCVIAHTRKGPTTEAPHLRAWGGRYGVEEDGKGSSVLDYYLGRGAHLEAPLRAQWRAMCAEGPEERRAVELLLAGLTI